MQRRPFTLILTAVLLAFSTMAIAAPNDDDDDDDMTFDPVAVDQPDDGQGEPEIEMEDDDDDVEPEPEEPEPEPEPDLEPEPGDGVVKADEAIALSDNRVSWQDIVVVVRKPFLKTSRIDAVPLFGVTMNDNLIQHLSYGAQVNYWLTDVLSVGVEGFGYIKNLREPFDLVARQARRLPTVNQYNWSFALNFNYVPVYGKFAILDKNIVTWEVFFTAGVGATQSEVIPRDPALRPFTNFLITPNIGATMRFFITKWLTINVGVRDYLFVDQFEAVDRTPQQTVEQAKENASSAFVNNVMFQAGIAIWYPFTFKYTTFR